MSDWQKILGQLIIYGIINVVLAFGWRLFKEKQLIAEHDGFGRFAFPNAIYRSTHGLLGGLHIDWQHEYLQQDEEVGKALWDIRQASILPSLWPFLLWLSTTMVSVRM